MHSGSLTTRQKWRFSNSDHVKEHDRKRDAIRNMTPERRAQKLAAQKRYAEKHKDAIRARNLPRRRMYAWRKKGIPFPPYEAPSVCECCGGPPIPTHALAVDHCHRTGKFRGWLCQRCNTGIGMLGDTIEGLMLAVKYLSPAPGGDLKQC